MQQLIKRFQEKFIINKENGCWEWQACLTKKGYGRFAMGGKIHFAHRASYFIHKGNIFKEMLILHSCDNPKCVNPEHLREGTHKDNAIDAVERGRNFQTKKTACPKCGGNYTFNAQNARICVPCFNKYNKKLYNETKEKVLARQMAKRDKDRDAYNAQEREYRKEYRKKNSERINKYYRDQRRIKKLDIQESTKL